MIGKMAHTEKEVLLSKLEQARKQVEVGAEYQHAKTGGRYIVTALAIKEDDEEIRVIYQAVGNETEIMWDRSLGGPSGWLAPVEIEGKKVARFTKVSS